MTLTITLHDLNPTEPLGLFEKERLSSDTHFSEDLDICVTTQRFVKHWYPPWHHENTHGMKDGLTFVPFSSCQGLYFFI